MSKSLISTESTNTNENKRPRGISSDEDGVAIKMMTTNITGSSGIPTVCTDTTETSKFHPTQPRAKSFAPSIGEYLNQRPEPVVGDDIMRAKKKKKCDESVFLRYLPRPEWCGPLVHIMRSQLEIDMAVYNQNNPQHPYTFCMSKVASMSVDHYDLHLSLCVTNNPAYHVAKPFYKNDDDRMLTGKCTQYIYDDDDKSEEEESDEEGSDEEEMWDEEIWEEESDVEELDEVIVEKSREPVHDHPRNSQVDHQNENVHNNKYGGVDKGRQNEAIDFVKGLLQSNVIYFDIDAYMWRTRRIPNNDNDSGTTPSLLDPHSRYQITYEELIQRQYEVHQSGIDRHTILHMAIEDHVTHVAMDIIRSEYNTFQDCVARQEDLEYWPGKITWLEMANTVGVTPLILATQKGNIQVVQELLNCDISTCYSSSNQSTGSALLQAAHLGRTKIMESIIQNYCDDPAKNLVDLIENRNANETTPLMRAAQEGQIAAVQLLLKNEALVNCQNRKGMTPLMFAAQRGQKEVCRLLIQNMADLNLQTKLTKSTALLLACRHGQVDIVKELLIAGSELHRINLQSRTARQVIQDRMQLRADTTALEPNEAPQIRGTLGLRHTDEVQQNEDIDGGIVIGNHDIHLISKETDAKIVRMLNLDAQIEFMQSLFRVERNYEIIRFHSLLQTNRANICFRDGSTFDVPTVAQFLTEEMAKIKDSETLLTMSNPIKSPHLQQNPEPHRSTLPFELNASNRQMLVHVMLLPAPLVKTIALFLPLPNLWDIRIKQLCELHEAPNDVIVHALDIIDEILEEGGLLYAFDKAQIPAPTPHQRWCNWKRSTMTQASQSNTDNEGQRDESDVIPTTQERLSVTAAFPPSPQDKKHPTIRELRRVVCYSMVLNKYESQTNIVSILLEEPYKMTQKIIDQVIRIADLASICRRCCIEPCLPFRMSTSFLPAVKFEADAALDILVLTRDLEDWSFQRRLFGSKHIKLDS